MGMASDELEKQTCRTCFDSLGEWKRTVFVNPPGLYKVFKCKLIIGQNRLLIRIFHVYITLKYNG